jgi:parallel beta-helix repeat protein
MMAVIGSFNFVRNNSAAYLDISGSQNKVVGNLFTGQIHGSGLFLDGADHNVFSNNNIYGLYFRNGSDNLFYGNRIGSGVVAYGLQSARPNSFDNGSTGNYWSDYSARYPNATEVDNSGIWNTPYAVYGNVADNHPLMNRPKVPEAIIPGSSSEGEPSSTGDLPPSTSSTDNSSSTSNTQNSGSLEAAIILAAATVAVVAVGAVGVLVYLKKRKRDVIA